LLPGYFV